MAHELFDLNDNRCDPFRQSYHVELTRMEMALIIEALLQAEVTLPLLDPRYRALKPIESLRLQQLSLANRLEDVMAGSGRWQDHAHHQSTEASPRRTNP